MSTYTVRAHLSVETTSKSTGLTPGGQTEQQSEAVGDRYGMLRRNRGRFPQANDLFSEYLSEYVTWACAFSTIAFLCDAN